MPSHVDLLLWPSETTYKIEEITNAIKGRMAKKYVQYCIENERSDKLNSYKVRTKAVDLIEMCGIRMLFITRLITLRQTQ
jgi:hypothetical protein